MRVVLDTNVVVAGIFWSGPPRRVLDSWAAGRFTLCGSAAILDEYFEVIERLTAKCGRADLARRWQAWLFAHSQLTNAASRYPGCRTIPMTPCLWSARWALAPSTW